MLDTLNQMVSRLILPSYFFSSLLIKVCNLKGSSSRTSSCPRILLSHLTWRLNTIHWTSTSVRNINSSCKRSMMTKLFNLFDKRSKKKEIQLKKISWKNKPLLKERLQLSKPKLKRKLKKLSKPLLRKSWELMQKPNSKQRKSWLRRRWLKRNSSRKVKLKLPLSQPRTLLGARKRELRSTTRLQRSKLSRSEKKPESRQKSRRSSNQEGSTNISTRS